MSSSNSPQTPNPNSNPTASMSSSNSPQTREPKPESQALTQESSDPRSDTNTSQTLQNTEERDALLEKDSVESITGPNGGQEEEEEEEGECGFCLFMKGGGCKDTFIEWEKCVEEGEKNKEDIVEKCFQATAALKKCMEAHSDYYAPILQAEKVAEEEAVKELEKEKERLNSQGDGEKLGSEEKQETLKGSQQKKES